jgi:hypothetical protein
MSSNNSNPVDTKGKVNNSNSIATTGNKNNNKNKPTNLSKKVNNITNSPNNLVINNSKCNETLKVNFKPAKTNNNKSNTPDNSEGKMACIIS